MRPHRGKLVAAGTLLGAGLGGFADGIVLHQILQWHNMLSSKVPPLTVETIKYNMVFDGLFHAGTWLMTVTGFALLWRWQHAAPGPWCGRTLGGALALGWGLFNVVEGTIDHQLLGLHHVHPGSNQLAWDVGFVLFGVALSAAGWASIRAGRPSGTDEVSGFGIRKERGDLGRPA